MGESVRNFNSRSKALSRNQLHTRKRNSRRLTKRAIVLLIVVIIFLAGVWLGTSIIPIRASDNGITNQRIKYTKSIFIEPGDSLWSIAKKYKTEEYKSIKQYVKEVKEMNGLKSNQLNAGAYLCVPYFE